jgi:tRNA-Thr(GGU) m(6)t(6)A37 methyltransferase TsaA
MTMESKGSMTARGLSIAPVGVVRSPLKSRKKAPMQPDPDTPSAWIELMPDYAKAVKGLEVGQPVVLITWLHRAKRDVLQVHRGGDRSRPLTGVFATRSPDRPNPIGLHTVEVLAIEDNRIKVGPLEAIDGTPVVDIKRML